MQKEFKNALKDTTDICKFEFWLRFYFVQQNDNENLYIQIPEETMQHISEEYDTLAKLAEKLNNTHITPEKSQDILINHISESLDGPKYSHSLIPRVLNSKSFEAEIYAFHIWINANQAELESRTMDFKEWMQLFEEWKRTEQGQNLLLSLKASNTKAPDSSQ